MGGEDDGGRERVDRLPEDVFDGARSVLLMGSPMDPKTLETGLSLLAGDDVERTRVLWVTLLNTSREVVDIWDDHFPARPERLRVVPVGDGLAVTNAVSEPHVGVHAAEDPADLTTVGVRVLNALSALEADDEAVDVCLRFDSLTPLSQYVSQQALCRFLHVLTTRLADAGVRSHFHLDPMAHDSQTVHALGAIFDTQVRVEEDGVSLTQR